jgi:hypothetical protein
MATPQVHVIVLRLRDLPLLPRRRNNRRQLSGAALEIQRVIVRVVLVPHPEQNIGIAERMFCLE